MQKIETRPHESQYSGLSEAERSDYNMVEDVFAPYTESGLLHPAIANWSKSIMRKWLVLSPTKEIREMGRGKVIHTGQVIQSTADIATGFPDGVWDVRQAAVVALNHDIARFQQAQFGTFSDTKSRFNHAVNGAAIVQNAGLQWEQYGCDVATIVDAIQHHSDYAYSGSNSYAMLIRDADKVALLRHPLPVDPSARGKPGGTLSPQVKSELLAGGLVRGVSEASRADRLVYSLSWLHDINFEQTRRLITQEGIAARLLSQLQNEVGSQADEIVAHFEQWQEAAKQPGE